MQENTRRKLIKRLALIAAAGYVAPQVLRIDTALAHHKAGHAGGCSVPPCA